MWYTVSITLCVCVLQSCMLALQLVLLLSGQAALRASCCICSAVCVVLDVCVLSRLELTILHTANQVLGTQQWGGGGAAACVASVVTNLRGAVSYHGQGEPPCVHACPFIL